MSEEEIEKDIIMQIEMESYMKYNDTIATMNDHLGEIYSYKDVEDIEKAQLKFEKELAYKYLKQEHQALLDIKEYIKENREDGFDEDGYDDAWYDKVLVQPILDIINKALGVDK